MTYTFKLSRRIARLRAPLFTALLIALTGCDNARSFDPELPDAVGQGSATDNPIESAAFAGGIPFGNFGQPTSEFGSVFNGAHRIIYPQYLLRELAAIKARGGKVALRLSYGDRYLKDSDGHFSLSKWKDRVDQYKGIDFSSYISDGTIIGHYLIDEPHDAANWNGRPIPQSTLEEMARHSKERWPSMVTIVRTWPDYLDNWSGSYRYLDAAWAQYAANRWPNADAFLKENVSKAQAKGLGLVVGLNLLDGSPTKGKMSASQVESYGSALLSSTYPCAFVSWKYDEAHMSSSGMGNAMAALRRLAQNRSSRTCRGATSSGGGTPPPSEPPPSEPPPPEPPSSSGVPFGPYGLPTSEMVSFTGLIRGATPSNVLVIATAARKAGSRVILRLSGNDVANANGTFSLTKWKAALDRYASVNLSSYVSDGTIAGHMLVQNPHNAGAWGGQRIPYATLEEMARYSRQRWPALPTFAHAPPSWLGAKTTPWQYLDAASVMYSGSAGDAGAWVSKQASAAGQARLGLLVGMNVLNGGTSASRLAGTTQGKFAMSASQLQTWGSALVAHSRVCGLLMSRYDEGYFGRSDVKQAVAVVGEKARTRAATSCRVRT
jgi:hypothetical protein